MNVKLLAAILILSFSACRKVNNGSSESPDNEVAETQEKEYKQSPATYPEHDRTKRKNLKVAAAQILTGTDVKANLKKIEARIREADSLGCDVVLFHEGALTGYPDRGEAEELDFVQIRQAEEKIRRLAGNLGIAVLVGTNSRPNDTTLYNDLLIIDNDGQTVGRYAKTWRAGEPFYTKGTGPVIFNVAGVEATCIICHDLRYPNLVRLPVALGARIVFIANNESGLLYENKQTGYHAMQVSRATENYIYAVMCNAPADPEDVSRHGASHGNSKIVGPLGNVLDEAGHFEERLVIAHLNLEHADRGPAARTAGQNPWCERTYGCMVEHEDYTHWVQEGLKMVSRLEKKP